MSHDESDNPFAALREALIASGQAEVMPERSVVEKITPSTSRDILEDDEIWEFIAHRVQDALDYSLSAVFDVRQVDWENLASDLTQEVMAALTDTDLTQYPSLLPGLEATSSD